MARSTDPIVILKAILYQGDYGKYIRTHKVDKKSIPVYVFVSQFHLSMVTSAYCILERGVRHCWPMRSQLIHRLARERTKCTPGGSNDGKKMRAGKHQARFTNPTGTSLIYLSSRMMAAGQEPDAVSIPGGRLARDRA